MFWTNTEVGKFHFTVAAPGLPCHGRLSLLRGQQRRRLKTEGARQRQRGEDIGGRPGCYLSIPLEFHAPVWPPVPAKRSDAREVYAGRLSLLPIGGQGDGSSPFPVRMSFPGVPGAALPQTLAAVIRMAGPLHH